VVVDCILGCCGISATSQVPTWKSLLLACAAVWLIEFILAVHPLLSDTCQLYVIVCWLELLVVGVEVVVPHTLVFATTSFALCQEATAPDICSIWEAVYHFANNDWYAFEFVFIAIYIELRLNSP
jgi:hypothetical protein